MTQFYKSEDHVRKTMEIKHATNILRQTYIRLRNEMRANSVKIEYMNYNL